MSAGFDDGKDSGAFRTIGELAHALGLKPHVLRYWEQQFPALQPLKRSGGRRYYRPEDIALVERIDLLVNREGYTLKGAIRALSGKEPLAAPVATPRGGGSPPEHAAELVGDDGLDAFFGRAASAVVPPSASAPSPAVMPELVARLKSIRQRLAGSLQD